MLKCVGSQPAPRIVWYIATPLGNFFMPALHEKEEMDAGLVLACRVVCVAQWATGWWSARPTSAGVVLADNVLVVAALADIMAAEVDLADAMRLSGPVPVVHFVELIAGCGCVAG